MQKRIIRRLIIWVVFGFLLTLAPILVVAFIDWKSSPLTQNFLQVLSGGELLAVAFTLAAAAAADALLSKTAQTPSEWNVACGSITLILAFFTAMVYVVIKTHAYHIEDSQVNRGIAILYMSCICCAFICEAISEI